MKKIISQLNQKILFKNKLEKIKNEKIKKYWFDFFNLKNIYLKIIIFLVVIFISSLLFFILRDEALKNWTCLLNYGSGLNTLSGNQPLVYGLKITFGIVFILLFIFFNKWYFCTSFLLIGWNSILNVIDKSIIDIYNQKEYINTVVDYIPFRAFNFYNNIADILIFVGLFGIIFSFIYWTYKVYKNDNYNNEENNNDINS